MKKLLFIIFALFFFLFISGEYSYAFLKLNNENIKMNNYKQNDTISFNKYLYSKKTKRDLKSLKLNNNGDVIFKNKVVLTNKGVPLNVNTAYTDTEFEILFAAKGIKPRENCNPRDISKNGSLGCFIDNPDKK